MSKGWHLILHKFGKERILTNRSGVFGWGGNAMHEVHVFDNTGCDVELQNIKTTEKDGKTWTEIRVGEGWSTVILRK